MIHRLQTITKQLYFHIDEWNKISSRSFSGLKILLDITIFYSKSLLNKLIVMEVYR